MKASPAIKILDICVAKDTLIMTSIGWKRADEIEPGMEVLTHNNQYKNVKKVYTRIGETKTYRAARMPWIRATDNHPFLAAVGSYDGYGKREMYEPTWIAAGKLSKWVRHKGGSLLVSMPSPSQKTNDYSVDGDTAWAIGYYMAEGTVGHHQVSFAMHRKELKQRERISRYINSLGNKVCERDTDDNGHSVYFSNKEWLLLARDIGVSLNKTLPAFVYHLPIKDKLQVLAGYVSGDGYAGDGGVGVASISQKLAFGMWKLFRDCGYTASIHYAKRDGYSCRFIHKNGKEYIGNPQWKIQLNPSESKRFLQDVEVYKDYDYQEPKSKNHEVIEKDGKLLHPLRSVEDFGEELVYNFEVEDDNSYVANGYIVHNCDPDWTENPTVNETVKYVDAITCPTEPFVKHFSKYTDKPIVVIPDRLDMEYYKKQKEHKGDAKKVVWFGYSHNSGVLQQAIPTLRELKMKLTVISDDFKIFIGSNDDKDLFNFIKYDEKTVNRDIIKHGDIALLPPATLDDNGEVPYRSRFKSNNKTINSWGLGLPVATNAEELEHFIPAVNRIKEADERWEEVKAKYDSKLSVIQYLDLIKQIYG